MIRIATKQDAFHLLEIYAPYILGSSATFEYEVPSLCEFEQRISQISQQFPWLVWEQDGELLGYSYASPFHSRAAYQWSADLSIYLRPEAQSGGIGSRLYQVLMELLQYQGYYTVYAEVTGENTGSLRFHQKMGFHQEGVFQKTGYKFERWHDLITLSKSLHSYEDGPKSVPISFLQLDDNLVTQILQNYSR